MLLSTSTYHSTHRWKCAAPQGVADRSMRSNRGLKDRSGTGIPPEVDVPPRGLTAHVGWPKQCRSA
eukprot:12905245-Prorocentrum_lima.AAC.1